MSKCGLALMYRNVNICINVVEVDVSNLVSSDALSFNQDSYIVRILLYNMYVSYHNIKIRESFSQYDVFF